MNLKKSTFYLLLFLISLTMISFAQTEARPAKNPIIHKINLDLQLTTLSTQEISSLIKIQHNDPYNPEIIDKEKQRLLQTGLFESVSINTSNKNNLITLDYKLIQARLIRKVTISGQNPFLAEKILRLCQLRSGEAFKESLIPESIQRIKDYFFKQGFNDTSVDIHTYPDNRKQTIDIEIIVKRGKSYKLGSIEIIGNHFYSEERLKNIIYGGSSFRLARIKKNIKKIEELYIKNGFVRARATLKSYELNKNTGNIDMVVEIKERKKLELHFVNNVLFRHQTLKEYVTFYKERGYDRFAVQRSQERLIDFYRLNGFFFINIESSILQSEDTVTVTFKINEGPRTRLKKIIFKGNESIGTGKLLQTLQSQRHTLSTQGFFQFELIPIDLENIVNYYHQNGYWDAKIVYWDTHFNDFNDQANLFIEIDEGKPYVIKSITIHGNSVAFSKETLLKKIKIKTNKIYNHDHLKATQNKLLKLYNRQGYPYTSIEIKPVLHREQHQIDLVVRVNEGTQARIRNIIINGEYKTKKDVILENLKIKPGDLYVLKSILDAQLNLKRLGIFDFVRITPFGIEEQKSDVDLVVFVEERKQLTVDFQAGFDSDKLGSGQVLITQRNLFGLGKQLQVRGVAGFELSRGEITYFSPRIFGASWNLVNQYFIEYEDDENFNAISFGGSLGTLKRFGPHFTVLLKSQVTRFDVYEDQSRQDILGENLFDNTFAENTIALSYDRRDNFADPQRGFYTVLSTQFNTDLSDITNNFNISEFSIAHYLGFLKRFTLINNLRTGRLIRINDASHIPVNKLFFMGGNDTVRGFDEDTINPAGGRTSIIYNLELHYRLFDSFKLAGFFDAGSLTNTLSEISNNSIRQSAGVGLRYITPVGPIRLDYGWVLDKRTNEDGQRFHFSFGYFF